MGVKISQSNKWSKKNTPNTFSDSTVVSALDGHPKEICREEELAS